MSQTRRRAQLYYLKRSDVVIWFMNGTTILQGYAFGPGSVQSLNAAGNFFEQHYNVILRLAKKGKMSRSTGQGV